MVSRAIHSESMTPEVATAARRSLTLNHSMDMSSAGLAERAIRACEILSNRLVKILGQHGFCTLFKRCATPRSLTSGSGYARGDPWAAEPGDAPWLWLQIRLEQQHPMTGAADFVALLSKVIDLLAQIAGAAVVRALIQDAWPVAFPQAGAPPGWLPRGAIADFSSGNLRTSRSRKRSRSTAASSARGALMSWLWRSPVPIADQPSSGACPDRRRRRSWRWHPWACEELTTDRRPSGRRVSPVPLHGGRDRVPPVDGVDRGPETASGAPANPDTVSARIPAAIRSETPPSVGDYDRPRSRAAKGFAA